MMGPDTHALCSTHPWRCNIQPAQKRVPAIRVLSHRLRLAAMQEVDRGVAGMVAQLEPRLRAASTPLQEAGEAMAILLQLQADGAPCVASAQPIQLFLETLVRMTAVHLHSCGSSPGLHSRNQATQLTAMACIPPEAMLPALLPPSCVHSMHVGRTPSGGVPGAVGTLNAPGLQQGGAQQAMGACVAAHEAALQSLIQRAESDAATRVRPASNLHACVPLHQGIGWSGSEASSTLCTAWEVSLGPARASRSLRHATSSGVPAGWRCMLQRPCLAGHRCGRPQAS